MAKKQKVSRRMRRYLNAGKAGLNKSAELSRRDLRRQNKEFETTIASPSETRSISNGRRVMNHYSKAVINSEATEVADHIPQGFNLINDNEKPLGQWGLLTGRDNEIKVYKMTKDSLGEQYNEATYSWYSDVMDYAINNPVLEDYIRYTSVANVKRTQAWHGEAEKMYAILQMGTVDQNNQAVFDIVPHAGKIEGEKSYQMTAVCEMLISKTFVWRDDVIRTATGMPLPKHTITKDIMAFPNMFWTYESPLVMEVEDSSDYLKETNFKANFDGSENQYTAFVDWTHVWNFEVDNDDTFKNGIVMAFNLRGKNSQVTVVNKLQYGDTYPDSFETPESQKVFLSLMNFLNTPMVQKDPEDRPRAMRKRMARDPRLNEIYSKSANDNHVVYLRKPVFNKSNPTEGDTKIKRDFQWWVKGHYRSQYYPSTRTNKLIWIAPFLKGEQGMPIRATTYMVVR
tara:strand:- start:235 stop:1599 length:1365 start_codon:yes stop_codon:yes gene_type:complete